MAEVVLGFASSHGPTIATVPEEWDRIVERDKRDPRYDFAQLLRNAPPSLADEITIEKKRARWQACQDAIGKLGKILDDAEPDVVVVVSNPHGILPDDTIPALGVFRGATMPDRPAERPAARDDRTAQFAGPPPVQTSREERPPREFFGYPPLAEHLIASLIDEDFDVASSEALRREHGLDEAFRTLYDHYEPTGTIPIVPLILSRYLPSQATPRRCHALGGALRRAVESWPEDKRIVLMASSGLSHQIVDEELDRTVVDALVERDFDTLDTLPRDRLNRAPGTPEILNWITVAAAMDPLGMTLVDYVPCYRSLAGTGHGVTFGYWK
jgi:3-O-methylgallate 3,4-dioxygenase